MGTSLSDVTVTLKRQRKIVNILFLKQNTFFYKKTYVWHFYQKMHTELHSGLHYFYSLQSIEHLIEMCWICHQSKPRSYWTSYLVTYMYWKHVVEAELSKLTYVEDFIIISPLFLAISLIFLQKSNGSVYYLLDCIVLLLKIYPSLWTSARNLGTLLAIFGTFRRKSPEININRWELQFYWLWLVIFQLRIPGVIVCSESILLAEVLRNSAKIKPRQHSFVFPSVASPFILGLRLN